MSFSCSNHGWSHLLNPCPWCFQHSMSGDATDTSKVTFTKEQAIDLAIETWKAREVCWNTEREQLRSKLSAAEKERDNLRDFREEAIKLLDGYYDKFEPLIQERDDLKAKLAVAVEALKTMSSVTYGTELCNSDEENNEILANNFFRHQKIAEEALKAINGVG